MSCARATVLITIACLPVQLLEFSVKEGWEPLCAFLGVPVPDEPFPYSKTTDVMNARFKRCDKAYFFFSVEGGTTASDATALSFLQGEQTVFPGTVTTSCNQREGHSYTRMRRSQLQL